MSLTVKVGRLMMMIPCSTFLHDISCSQTGFRFGQARHSSIGLDSLGKQHEKNILIYYITASGDPQHDISINCVHAMVRSVLPWWWGLVVLDFAYGSSVLALLL